MSVLIRSRARVGFRVCIIACYTFIRSKLWVRRATSLYKQLSHVQSMLIFSILIHSCSFMVVIATFVFFLSFRSFIWSLLSSWRLLCTPQKMAPKKTVTILFPRLHFMSLTMALCLENFTIWSLVSRSASTMSLRSISCMENVKSRPISCSCTINMSQAKFYTVKMYKLFVFGWNQDRK